MSPIDIGASVRQRLLNRAKQTGEGFQRTLVRYAIERLLHRLGQTRARDLFVLKGAMLFVAWPGQALRPTGDLDLLGRGDPGVETITDLFVEVCAVEDPADGILFEADSITAETVRDDAPYQGIRLALNARLARAIIPVQVDIGFGDAVHPSPERRAFPCLLDGMGAPSILMYPPETVVAEKFEAMVRFGPATSRMKDFSVIWVVSRTFDFERSTLAQAVGGTFRRRGTNEPAQIPLPLTQSFADLPDKQRQWSGFLRRNPPALPPPPFDELLADLRRFLGPVIDVLAHPDTATGAWNHERGRWE